ncbi:hypothetical protein LCGC14_1591270 [marine sediment metagenome]|uniref:Phage ABA sandwich domain-containing protein n=1 Tax=marine sediment metagenome TaxID=412755 RepID=A0A0F9LEA5_9ZZZZ
MNCPHCETRINRHEAIRCLDAWIAEYVMGWKPYKIVRHNILYPPIMQANADEYPVIYKPFDPDREYDFDSSHFFDSRVLGGYTQPRVPKYSIEIQNAWWVVEKLRLSIFPNRLSPLDPEGGWGASQPLAAIDLGDNPTMSLADTAPLAICRAAIKAKGKENGNDEQTNGS